MAQTNMMISEKAEKIIADVKYKLDKKGEKKNKHAVINYIIETWKSK